MKKGFVVSAVLYPLLVMFLVLVMGILAMGQNRRKILDNMKLEVSEESETDPEMSNSTLYYKMKALEEAYAEMSSRLSEERMEEIQADYESKINTAKTQAKLEAFPVGSIFTSTTSTNPSSYIGGTWEAYGQGRTLVGVGTGTDSNSKNQTFSAGATGGEYTHTLTANEIPSHTHSIPTLSGTTTSSGVHNHAYSGITENNENHRHGLRVTLDRSTIAGERRNVIVGGGVAWSDADYWPIREAGIHHHTYSGTTENNGTHSHTVTTVSSITGSTGNAGSHNNISPYITVYFWKRTK